MKTQIDATEKRDEAAQLATGPSHHDIAQIKTIPNQVAERPRAKWMTVVLSAKSAVVDFFTKLEVGTSLI